MSAGAERHNVRAIRELLLEAFASQDLRRFCQDRPIFRPLVHRFSPDHGLDDIVAEVVDYCEKHALLDELLDGVKEFNPRQYERFEPQLRISAEALARLPRPYRGLQPFEAKHAKYYFGRDAMVEQLLGKLRRHAFVAVVGPSGCGKSSLLRAGMVPALRKGDSLDSGSWRVETFLPGDDPLRALALTLVRVLMPDATRLDQLTAARKLADYLLSDSLPIADVLAEVKEQAPDVPRLVLVADQFEETYTLCADEEQRQVFLEVLVQAAETPWVKVVLSLRADFFGRVLEDESFGRRVDAGLVNVLPMSREERRAAVEKPALRAGRRFEEGLVERILDAVEGSPGNLPLLEFALTELWRRQTAGGLLTHEAYEAIGMVQGAIARSADDTFARFSHEEQQAVRSIFTRLVRVARPDEGAEDTRRRIRLDALPPEAQALVKRLADDRLLVTSSDPASGAETVEVAHEALIRGWRPLQEWLNRDREFLLWRQRLDTLARIWEESGRGEGGLLRDALLQEAQVRSAGRLDELSAQEQTFLEESEAAAHRAEAAREAARQRELEQARKLAEEQRLRAEASEARRVAEEARARDAEAAAEAQRRSSARLQRLALGLVLVLIIALLVGWLAIRQGQIAKGRSLIAESLLRVRDGDLRRATLLALEAQAYEPNEAERILNSEIPTAFSTSSSDIGTSVLRTGAGVDSVAWSPDGRTVAWDSRDGTITLWSWERSEAVGILGLAGPPLAWSPDGRTLASGSSLATIKLWDVARGEAVQTLQDHWTPVNSLAWSPDGQTLASGSLSGTILWDVAEGEAVQTLPGDAYSVAWSLDGRSLASGSNDGTIKVWDVAQGDVVQTLRGHEDRVTSVAWSPDGQSLASGSWDATIKVWDVARGEAVRTLQAQKSVTSVDWNSDGSTLASGSSDGTINLWDMAGGEVVHTLQGHEGYVNSVAYNDWGLLASGSSDGTFRLWVGWLRRDPCGPYVPWNLTPAEWLQFMGWSIYRPTCPGQESEPAPSVADAFEENPEYLLITWPGRLVVLASGLVGLTLVGLMVIGSYRLVRWLLCKILARSEVAAS